MLEEMYLYRISSPLDVGWRFMDPLGDKAAEVMSGIRQTVSHENAFGAESSLLEDIIDLKAIFDLLNLWECARAQLSSIGWEGDIRKSSDSFGQPHIFTTVCETKVSMGLVIKQENNGTTFVVSRVPLPHLEGIVDDSVVTRVASYY